MKKKQFYYFNFELATKKDHAVAEYVPLWNLDLGVWNFVGNIEEQNVRITYFYYQKLIFPQDISSIFLNLFSVGL
jgi:hypothetical protein